MSLLADVQERPRLRPGPPCSVVVVRARLSAAEAAELDDLLADPAVTKTAVSRALRDRGLHVSGQTLSRHTRGDCACTR